MDDVKKAEYWRRGSWLLGPVLVLGAYAGTFSWVLRAYGEAAAFPAIIGAFTAPFAGLLACVGLYQAGERSRAMHRAADISNRQLDQADLESRAHANRDSARVNDDKFFESTKRLVADDLTMRVAALYVLESIGDSDTARQQIIVNVLCHWIRSETHNSTDVHGDEPCDPTYIPITSSDDYKLAVRIVTKRDWDVVADLGSANLRGLRLRDANLSNACLANANLQGADCEGAVMTGATLAKACLDGANLCAAVDLTIGQVLWANSWDRGTSWTKEIGLFMINHDVLDQRPRKPEELVKLLVSAMTEFPKDTQVKNLHTSLVFALDPHARHNLQNRNP